MRGLLALALLSWPGPAAAHPHVWIEYGVAVVVREDGGLWLEFEWTFDELFSSMIVESFDRNRDRAFSPPEAAAVEQKAFQSYRADNYFLDLALDRKPLKVEGVRDFRVRLDGNRVSYTFGVGPWPLAQAAGVLEIRVDDPTYFIAFGLRKASPVRASAPPALALECRTLTDTKGFDPDAARCAYRRTKP